MTNTVDFDALARKAIQSDGALEDLGNLYGHAFALPQWHFIARGEFPDVKPYIASNVEHASGQPTVRAFTDTDRLLRFVKENNLQEADGGQEILSIPTDNILDYLEPYMAEGVHGIWFNSDSGSEGFSLPLKHLRPVKQRLAEIVWKPNIMDSPVAPSEGLSDPLVGLDRLATLMEENAELMKGYDAENAFLSAVIGGAAEAMDEKPQEKKGESISSVAEMLDSVRIENNMSPKLFAFFIELCLEKRKFLIPVLAFALCAREEDKVRRLEQDEELRKELARWITIKLVPGAALLLPPAAELAPFTPTQCWRLTNGQYLLQGKAERLPSGVPSIRLPNGEVLHQVAPYYLVTDKGDVIQSYPTPCCSSLEDTLYMTDIHAVTDGQLCEFFWQQQLDDAEKVQAQIVNLPAFLRECECSELPFDPAHCSDAA